MNSYFVASMVRLRDRAAKLAKGSPLISSVVIAQRHQDGTITYTPIVPDPYVNEINPKLVSAFESAKGIKFEVDDMQIQGISSVFANNLLGGGVYFIVGGTYDPDTDTVTGGAEYERVYTFPQENMLTYDIVVRKKASGTPRLPR